MYTSRNRKQEIQRQEKSSEENFFAPSWQRMATEAIQRQKQSPAKGPRVPYDLDEMLQMKQPVQRQDESTAENRTGMPDQLKNGLEQMSGFDLSGVRVHRNSSKPAQLNALAYAQGQEIHLGPGQEQHLPHEAWHVVQQMQGRVKPTMKLDGVGINDDVALEREADVMGAKVLGSNIQRKESEERETNFRDSQTTSTMLPTQGVMATLTAQCIRPVTNSQAANMRASLARVFGGSPRDYQIDQNSGTTFNDNNGENTTGHHGVAVTDTRDGSQYSCDFHNNGRYYTRV